MRTQFVFGILLLAIGNAYADKDSAASPFTGFYKNYSQCRDQYAAMDKRVDAAGVRDAASYRVPGFPYLRSDRMLASFRTEVHGLEEVSEWVHRMRELDQDARDVEYANIGMNELELATQRDRFLNCGRVLAAIEFEDPETWARMVEHVLPADGVATVARSSGEKRAVATVISQEVADYLRPLAAPTRGSELRLWRATPSADLSLLEGLGERIQINTLGFPGLVGSEWRALAVRHAPQLWIETANEGDLLASPVLLPAGPGADTAKPRVDYEYGFTRFGGDLLVQINYFVWFKSAKGSTTTPIDGFIWRVTLDEKLQPLVFESLHTSGRNHRWYPVQALKPRNADGAGPDFIAPESAPAYEVAQRIGSGTHELRRVVSVTQAAEAKPQQYELRHYEELSTLPRPGGGTHSLFGPDGVIAGTHGAVKNDALRQYGHHAIETADRVYFDDPYLLESTFLPPAKPAKPVEQITLAGH